MRRVRRECMVPVKKTIRGLELCAPYPPRSVRKPVTYPSSAKRERTTRPSLRSTSLRLCEKQNITADRFGTSAAGSSHRIRQASASSAQGSVRKVPRPSMLYRAPSSSTIFGMISAPIFGTSSPSKDAGVVRGSAIVSEQECPLSGERQSEGGASARGAGRASRGRFFEEIRGSLCVSIIIMITVARLLIWYSL